MNDLAQGIGRREILKYAVLPGILPRARELFGSGFANLAWLMALVYSAVRLLPPGHPYLRPDNVGRYGIRHVIAEAARNLRFTRNSIDQVLIFFLLLGGMIMLLMQAVLIVLSLLAMPALAAMPTTPYEFLVTLQPEQDLAFILLDLVYGMPDFFGSCISQGLACEDTNGAALPTALVGAYPTTFHLGLHTMLEFYSYGIFLVGVIVIIYLSITITAETAQSGTPFGKRFNGLWAPIRLIFFFFLLAPILYGLNTAQLLVMYSAKFGSGLATNGWLLFNEILAEDGTWSLLGTPDTMLARPTTPEAGPLLQFMTTVTTCKYAERLSHDRYIQPYLVRNTPGTVTSQDFNTGQPGGDISSAVLLVSKYPADDTVTPGIAEAPSGTLGGPTGVTTFMQALQFFDGGNITIRYGEYNPQLYPNEPGNVYPWCGEIVIPNPGVAFNADWTGPGGSYRTAGNKNIAMISMFETWYLLFARVLWEEEPANLHRWGGLIARKAINNESLTLPESEELMSLSAEFKWYIDNGLKGAIEDQAANNTYAVPESLLRKGWGGAAIWYNTVAEINGGFVSSVFLMPRPKLWPDALEQIQKAQKKSAGNTDGMERFNPILKDGKTVEFNREEEAAIARAELTAYRLWQEGDAAAATFNVNGVGSRAAAAGLPPGKKAVATNNTFIDIINTVFGTDGLFDMRNNPNIHPFAQLSAIGKSLINHAIVAFGYAAGFTVLGGLSGLLQQWVGAMAETASGIAVTIGTIGLLVGFLLYYVLPFMPFIYFFFAVGGWIKGIFEAMVGVPLWALAHLRIDGDGLPGKAAMNGYFLIFEIFLRPLLIVFGLIAGVGILSAQVFVLNEVFDLVLVNLTGYDQSAPVTDPTDMAFYRGPIDQLFFTVVYAIIVYMMAMSSLKLIDLIPSQILRWLGAGVKTATEQEQDVAGKVLSLTSSGAVAIGAKFGQAGGMSRSALFSLLGRK